MSEKDKLSLEKSKLKEKKRRVSQVIGTINNEEDESLLPTSSKTVFDFLFKIVIVGDAVSRAQWLNLLWDVILELREDLADEKICGWHLSRWHIVNNRLGQVVMMLEHKCRLLIGQLLVKLASDWSMMTVSTHNLLNNRSGFQCENCNNRRGHHGEAADLVDIFTKRETMQF